VDVTKKKGKQKRKEKNIVKVYECVCMFFFYGCFYYYDKIAKMKEEFNILIGLRSRIINLYVSCISHIR